jgi:hypothetical protein
MINEQRTFLRDGQIGHKRAFEIDWQEAKRSDWFRLVPLGENAWFRQLPPTCRAGKGGPFLSALPTG